MSKIRYRQVHLDFHTSEYIPDIAADFDKDEFAKTLEEAHVDSITCFARCHHGWLYYPSKKFPKLIHPGLKNKNFLLEQIEACHKRGIKVPVYTTAQWDGRIMREHPEWLAVDENGEFIDTQGVPAPHFYHTICLNSGYRQFFKDQLQDMIEVIGVENLDGIFMDILFQVDCKCEHCVRKLKVVLVPARMGMREVLSPDGEVRLIERILGSSVHSSIIKPVVFSPTRISTVFVSEVFMISL